MPTVVLGRDIARRFTDGETRIDIGEEATTVRALVSALEVRFPGIAQALRTDMAVAIDGDIYQGAMFQPVAMHSEVCFLPAIEGG